jgi:nitrogen fixation/metabolism regulation signal transduction histidine kinase
MRSCAPRRRRGSSTPSTSWVRTVAGSRACSWRRSPYAPPDASTWSEAQDAVLIDTRRDIQALTGLVRLSAFENAYVYAIDLNREVFARLIEAEQAVQEYSDARDNRERIGAIFTLSYVETALLVLIGAVWLGMSAAGAIAAPRGPARPGGRTGWRAAISARGSRRAATRRRSRFCRAPSIA